MSNTKTDLPLSGIRVLEWGHTVMGPVCSMILADMGAEVIKIERAPLGDDTRRLPGFAVAFFPLFNRNKKSIALNLKEDKGKDVLRKLIASADVFLENFAPDAADRQGFGYEECKKINPRLVYCNLKGFMPGPYWKRPSLDNLVQMMGGLAYMTGRKGDPLRVGASATDIMGGIFGALGIITALLERKNTGKGNRVISTLYESVVFMVAQHMAWAAINNEPSVPMPEIDSAWPVYDLFDTADGEKLFIGLTSDFHWQRFCDVFGLPELKEDDRLQTNSDRVAMRSWIIPQLREKIATLNKDVLVGMCEQAKIPFAPLMRPDQLFDDPHLNESGGLVETTFPSGVQTRMPKIPLRIGDYDFNLNTDPPGVGQYGREVLVDIGLSDEEIDELAGSEIIVAQ
jgi:crotonobetainyl-CoA:carnitine CoA-transferase CaiB-like acyl-CoA transferase